MDNTARKKTGGDNTSERIKKGEFNAYREAKKLKMARKRAKMEKKKKCN